MEIPGFQILRELGRGGMATVYLAIQETLGRQVALKVMNPELASDDSFRERFVREGRVVARFRHPRIVTVYDFWKHGDILLLSMEYLPKRWTISQYLQAARNHLESRQLESASQEVMKGLRIAPSHPELLAFRDTLASAYHEVAQQELGTGDLESSRGHADQGLRLVPDHPGLLSLREQVAQRIAAIVKSDEILADIARLEKKGHWKEAMTIIEDGLAVAPAQPKLISAKAEIEKGLIRSLSEEVDRLCAEAQRTSDKDALVSCQRIIRDGLLCSYPMLPL